MDELTAARIRDLAYEIEDKLTTALELLKEIGSDSEIESLHKSTYDILGQIYQTMLHPAYEQHPSLRPPYNEETDKPLLQKIVDAAVAKGFPLSNETLEAIAKYGLTLPSSQNSTD
jgi:hypothetical protein